MKLRFLLAMQRELDCLRGAGLSGPGRDVSFALTGIGKVNAASATARVILEEKPDIVVNTGVAGGMLPYMEPLDLVIADRVAYHDVWCGEGNEPGQVQGLPRFFPSDPGLVKLAQKASSSCGRNAFTGLVCSGDQFFVSLEEDARIRAMYPEVLACDMESAAVAQVCHNFGVPFLCLRTISDVHTSEQVQRSQYSDIMERLSASDFEFVHAFAELI